MNLISFWNYATPYYVKWKDTHEDWMYKLILCAFLCLIFEDVINGAAVLEFCRNETTKIFKGSGSPWFVKWK